MDFSIAHGLAVSLLIGISVIRSAPAADDAGRDALTFSCPAGNDLFLAVTAAGIPAMRRDDPLEAVRAAPEGSGALLLGADPSVPTDVDPAVLAEAARKGLRLYVEFPARLPDLAVGPPRELTGERGVVVSDIFGARLPPMRIVAVHSGRYAPAAAARAHMVLAKVAGVDRAVFGLDGTPAEPLLFDHPRGDLLVATARLSGFVSGRYGPAGAWRTIWETILARLRPGAPPAVLSWTSPVRPGHGPDEPLPEDAEGRALGRAADWLARGHLLRHPGWPREALDRVLRYNTVRDLPAERWPAGDGSLGILEGFSSTVRPDGSQPARWAVRNDCVAEAAMLLAFDADRGRRPERARIAANLLDFIFGASGLAGGPRADPKSPSFGLVGWALDHPGSYWGDDNARALLAAGAVASLLGETRWNEGLARCILANLRTTGIRGFRPACVEEASLAASGWRALWKAKMVHLSPHYQAWIWACYLWAYGGTRFEPLLERSEAGLRILMAGYPDRWDWCLRSGTIERARILLPLAWLVRADDTQEHRGWLRRIAGDLAALRDRSGAFRETIGDGGPGIPSNAAFGTGETSLIQADGDEVCDLLYSCNFALAGLREASAATGDPFYRELEDSLARFLCRVQVRSEGRPELDGAWLRAFHTGHWEFWASSADWEWGPWCAETGWGPPWIAGTFGLRGRGTSLWDLLAKVDLREPLIRLRPSMLPDDALEAPRPARTVHGGLGRPARLAAPPDPRYPGLGAASLTDGSLGSEDHGDGEWLGFLGTGMDATVDLGAATRIRRVALRCLVSTGVGVLPPRSVEFAVSGDGELFRAVATVDPEAPAGHVPPEARTLTAAGLDVEARWVRIRAAPAGPLPAWITAGSPPSWLFVDEVLVNPGGS